MIKLKIIVEIKKCLSKGCVGKRFYDEIGLKKIVEIKKIFFNKIV